LGSNCLPFSFFVVKKEKTNQEYRIHVTSFGNKMGFRPTKPEIRKQIMSAGVS
jgi:hypothetical protein